MRIIRKRQSQKNRDGAAMVEMALVLPVFFAVVLGIVEFGRAMMVGQLVTNAAREAARLAIVDGTTNSEVEDWIEDFLMDSINVSAAYVTITITVDPAPGNPDPGDQLSVAQPRDLCTILVEVPFDQVSYIAPDFLAGKNLVGQSAMRHE